jgi:hypothetical protein
LGGIRSDFATMVTTETRRMAMEVTIQMLLVDDHGHSAAVTKEGMVPKVGITRAALLPTRHLVQDSLR